MFNNDNSPINGSKFGIYTENLQEDKNIAKQLHDQCSKMGDTVVFTDSMNTDLHDCALFPSFYIRFFKGTVIFLRLEDYLEHKNTMIGQPKLISSSSINKTLVEQNHLWIL